MAERIEAGKMYINGKLSNAVITDIEFSRDDETILDYSTTDLSYPRTITYEFKVSNVHMRNIFKIRGIYRLPGDKPLIHKGGKPSS